MIRNRVVLCLLSLAGFAAAGQSDLLRFTNGDQLHGTFLGIKDGPVAVWQRADLAGPVDFKITQVRHIVLRGGRPLKALESLSHVGLVNGDRIPGTLTAIDGDQITLDTACAGVLRIPRNQVAMLASNPLGGRVCFFGPFSEDGWKMTHASFPEGLPAAAAADAAGKEVPGKDGEADDKPGRWVFSGSAWYWQNKRAGTALIHENGMPGRAVLRFDMAWKNRLGIAVAFHADFAHPKAVEGDGNKGGNVRRHVPGDTADLPRLFGNSYVLQMHSGYMMLFRTLAGEDGKFAVERIQMDNNNLRLGESGQAKVEIRSNRHTGGISLFVNDEFVAQWSEGNAGGDGAAFAGKGGGFGFLVQGEDAQVRLSDVTVSEWNGMPDSARSMQVENQDIVLMANGIDRFSGRVTGFENPRHILFEGKHGKFQFPLDDIAEIRFARERLAPAAEVAADNLVVRLSPIGSISGRPVSGDGAALGILSPIIGNIRLVMDSAVMIDFNSSNQTLNDWDANF